MARQDSERVTEMGTLDISGPVRRHQPFFGVLFSALHHIIGTPSPIAAPVPRQAHSASPAVRAGLNEPARRRLHSLRNSALHRQRFYTLSTRAAITELQSPRLVPSCRKLPLTSPLLFVPSPHAVPFHVINKDDSVRCTSSCTPISRSIIQNMFLIEPPPWFVGP